jgi:hypothetical protein
MNMFCVMIEMHKGDNNPKNVHTFWHHNQSMVESKEGKINNQISKIERYKTLSNEDTTMSCYIILS